MKRILFATALAGLVAAGTLTTAVLTERAATARALADKPGGGSGTATRCYDCSGEGSTCRVVDGGYPNCHQGTTKWGMVWCSVDGDRSLCSKDAGGSTLWILW